MLRDGGNRAVWRWYARSDLPGGERAAATDVAALTLRPRRTARAVCPEIPVAAAEGKYANTWSVSVYCAKAGTMS